MALRIEMRFRPFCIKLKLRINFLHGILAQESVDQLSIAKSYKHSAKMTFAIQ